MEEVGIDTVHIEPSVTPMRCFYTDDVSEFVEFIEGFGLEYIEDNKIFCILFQLYEEESEYVDFDYILDYNEVLDNVDPERSSNRIFNEAHIAFNVENKIEYMEDFIDNLEKSFNS